MPSAKTRDEIQALIDQNAPLMGVCSKVANDIFCAERAKAIYLWIADHAGTINEAKFGQSFGIWQQMALTEMFVRLGRAFDEEKQGQTHCIRRIVLGLRNANLVNPAVLAEFVHKKCGVPLKTAPLCDDDHRAFQTRAVGIIESSRPTFANSDPLQKVLAVRHKEVAHHSDEEVLERPTFEDVDHCLDWGKEFIGMVGIAFGSHIFKYEDGGYWSDFGVGSALMSIRRLTHQARIVIDPKFAEMEKLMADLELKSET